MQSEAGKLSCNKMALKALYQHQTSLKLLLLPPTKEEVNAFARVCLSVCLLARLLKNACIDLDEMLPVDRYRDMD